MSMSKHDATSPTSEAHRQYILDGGCPYFDEYKTWCNDKVVGHNPGWHWATRINPNGTTTKVSLYNVKKAEL